MPTIIITDMSPEQLLAHAVKRANTAANEIAELATSPFEPGETQLDRALLVARHAFVLAEAWQIIDAMAHYDPSPTSSPPSPHRGVSSTGETN